MKNLNHSSFSFSLVEPDIGATNGVIHVIDRVLGVPQHTIAEKLAMDPMMSSVFSLGNQNHFNHMFNNSDEKFTYIVPSNLAWDEVNKQFTSAYKILFMGAFAYQVHNEVDWYFLKIKLYIALKVLMTCLTVDDNQEYSGLNWQWTWPQLKLLYEPCITKSPERKAVLAYSLPGLTFWLFPSMAKVQFRGLFESKNNELKIRS